MFDPTKLSVPVAMGWRDVLFANWAVDPAVVESRIPDPLSVDTYDGDAWLTVLPFVNVRVRPRRVPRWLGIRLPEVNLRTYVRHGGEPGIYFFSLDAHGVASVLGARATHHLPYFYARIGVSRTGDRVTFASRRRHPGARPCRFRATYRPTGEGYTAERGTLARFLTERHLLFTEDPWGRLRVTRARHPVWNLYDAEASISRNDLFEANGFDHPGGDPLLYYSPATETTTSASRLVADAGPDLLDGEPRL
jgi:uncharacterized protein YqjF (DUF2071 family)